MKKLAIVGRGTVGCTTVAHFIKFTDWDIDWYYDPNVSPTPVGEATNLAIMKTWRDTLDFTAQDHNALQSTTKVGIMKRGWGPGDKFLHAFPMGLTGIHFSGVTFQDHVFAKLASNKRVSTFEGNCTPEEIDSDYVIVCSGTPKDIDDKFIVSESIPVNACLVSQCEWDEPRFDYSLTYAMPNGWAFGIPLKNRCSIGYVHNDRYADKETISKEVEPLLNELGLAANKQNYLQFQNYYRKQNYSDRIVYNGNASFFLEPLEATSTSLSDDVNRKCWDLWFNKQTSAEQCNDHYLTELKNIELMISLHYAAGSIYETEFWTHAKEKGISRLKQGIDDEELFMQHLYRCLTNPNIEKNLSIAGSWDASASFNTHIDNLGLKDYLYSIVK